MTALRETPRPMRKRICILHNPAAGTSNRKRLAKTIALLRQASAHVEEIRTTRHGEGKMRAREAAMSGQFDLVAAAGGDGAAHDAAAGLAGGECPLGIIPLGTGNVLAREIGLSFAPADIARTLLTGPVKHIHLGQANGEPFLFVTGIGFDAAAARTFEAFGQRKLGRAGFVWPVLHALTTARNAPLRVLAGGAEHEAAWVIVTRVQHYAANIPLAPDASLFDDTLHAILFTGSGPLARIRDLAAMLSGQLPGNRHVRHLTARQLTIKGPPDTPVQIDGEIKGHLPLTLGIAPQKLPLIFPA